MTAADSPMVEPAAGLADPPVRRVLDRLFAGVAEDGAIVARARAEAAELAEPPGARLTSDLCAEASLAVTPDLGRFLYQAVRWARPAAVVEFGASFGVSAIHIAAALRDNGGGRLVTTELHEGKARAAAANLAEAGLSAYAEVVAGDARTALARQPGGPPDVDLLIMDGWKELYHEVLEAVEPRLRDGALVISDNLGMLSDDYVARLRRSGEYVSSSLPLGSDGVELSVRSRPAARG
ncbi:class I SAM-dependent methyltransferase [Streptomonospora sediminis]